MWFNRYLSPPGHFPFNVKKVTFSTHASFHSWNFTVCGTYGQKGGVCLKLSHHALLDWQAIKQKQQTAGLNLRNVLQLNYPTGRSSVQAANSNICCCSLHVHSLLRILTENAECVYIKSKIIWNPRTPGLPLLAQRTPRVGSSSPNILSTQRCFRDEAVFPGFRRDLRSNGTPVQKKNGQISSSLASFHLANNKTGHSKHLLKSETDSWLTKST